MTSLFEELGAGPFDAPLWVVGRDFGTEETRAQQPFVGPAGHVLDAALRAAGTERTSIRVDNRLPKQPPGNVWEAHTAADVAWGDARLDALLRAHRPKLIVALGNEVARFLLGDAFPLGEGITDLRGFLWDTPYGRVLTAVHPAAILREWTPWRALLDVDLRKAVREVADGCPALPERAVTIVTAPHELEELEERLHDSRGGVGRAGRGEAGGGKREGAQTCRTGKTSRSANAPTPVLTPHLPNLRSVGRRAWLAVDIENTDDRRLACVGFAPTPERAWVIPARDGWQLDAIRELCESAVPKVLQNGQYDRFFLRRFAGIELHAQVFDTMLAWHVLQPELAGAKTPGRRKLARRHTVKSLNFLASIYERDAFWKSYDFASEDERYVLCGRDAAITLSIAQRQAKQLETK